MNTANSANNEEDKYFSYPALDFLYNDMDDFFFSEQVNQVILVPFKINFNCNSPFNSVLLLNNFFYNTFHFPYVSINPNFDSKNYFLDTIHNYLFSILSSNNSNNSNDFKYDIETFIAAIEFKGIYVYEQQIYAFIDLSKLELNISLVKQDTLCWFGLMDEIVNKKHICNIPINNTVTDFFVNNNIFIYFKNSKEEQIEIPTVVYTGTHESQLHFKYVFGNTPCDDNSILGSGFYFTDYTNAIRQGGWSPDYKEEFKHGKELTENNKNGKYTKGGVIRYAVFLGNNLVKQNFPNDDVDNSEIKNTKLINTENNPEINMYEKMTLRISDHDGLWKQSYDSVYLGKLELDNGDFLKNTPIYVVHDYYKHTPLSYHHIDKTTLGDIFDENNNYYQIL
jgi:hypothetical protein